MSRAALDGVRHIKRTLLSSIVAAIVTLSAGLAVWQPASAEPARRTALPAGFVYLRDVDPTIEQGMRYAGYDNFVGHPLPGYDAAECVLRREVAAALKQVQADLAASNLSLKVYDCYRPTRAVQAMAQWAGDGRNSAATKRYFPKLRKENLFALGYIASRSEHSAGTTADLTIVEKDHPPVAAFDRMASYGPCTGPAAQRSPDDSIDMGTGLRLFRRGEPHREHRHQRRAAAPAQRAGRRDGEAGIPQLPPRMVALHVPEFGARRAVQFSDRPARELSARLARLQQVRPAEQCLCPPFSARPLRRCGCRRPRPRESRRHIPPPRPPDKGPGCCCSDRRRHVRSGSATTCVSQPRSSSRRAA